VLPVLPVLPVLALRALLALLGRALLGRELLRALEMASSAVASSPHTFCHRGASR
jgi:hypothetical protein